MKIARTLALAPPRTDFSVWWVLGAEAALAAFLLLSGSVPNAVIRGLQLFLRF